MKLKTKINTASIHYNHTQPVAPKNLTVKTQIKAAGIKFNHNQTATAQ